MSSGIIRPEQNIPQRINHKEEENIQSPQDISKKSLRTLSDFGTLSRKEGTELPLSTQQSKKETTIIEEPQEKQHKDSVEIKQISDSSMKDGDIIKETESTRKDSVEINDSNLRTQKQDTLISETETTKKDSIEISDNRVHSSKEDILVPEKDHTQKTELSTYEERLHLEKDEYLIPEKDHTQKAESFIDDTIREEKLEEEIKSVDNREQKQEIDFPDQTHKEKTENKIDDTISTSKIEENIDNVKKRDEKGESEIPDQNTGLKKTEIGFTKNGQDFNIEQHEKEFKVETDGYEYGQPDLQTKYGDSYTSVFENVESRTLLGGEEETERKEKIENGPAPIQVNKTSSQKEEDNFHYDESQQILQSPKDQDEYTFSEVNVTNDKNIRLDYEYALRVEKTNKKDVNNYTLVSGQQEPTKTYRTIGSMNDTTSHVQYRSLFTYKIENPENRFPNDPKNTNTPFNSSNPTNNENKIYTTIDSKRNTKLSDGVSEGIDLSIDREIQQEFEKASVSLNQIMSKQSSKNYSYEEILDEFIKSQKEQNALNESIIRRDNAVNSISDTNETNNRVNKKVADENIEINGVDNTQTKVIASPNETEAEYGQINRGSFSASGVDDGTYRSKYQTPLRVDGANLTNLHTQSPKIGDDGRELLSSESDINFPKLNESSVIYPSQEPQRRVNDSETDGDITLQEGTTHKYSPKIGERDGDTQQIRASEFRAADLFMGPAAQMSLGVDHIMSNIGGNNDIRVPYEINNDVQATNITNEIKYGTVKKKIDIRFPIISLLTMNSGPGRDLAQSIISNSLDMIIQPLSVAASQQAEKYNESTINDTFGNIATREILTDGVRFAYSRMQSAALYGPSQFGTSGLHIDNEIDINTPTGAVSKAVVNTVNQVLRISQSATEDDKVRRGLNTQVNKSFNQSAASIYNNLTSYINSLRSHLDASSALSSILSQKNTIENIDVKQQRKAAESRNILNQSPENTAIMSTLSPMEYKRSRANTTIASYNIEEDRRQDALDSNISWRKFNRTQKPQKETDVQYGQENWFASRGENQLFWTNNDIGIAYQNRINSYREAGFQNATEMAANDFRVEYFFFNEGTTIRNNLNKVVEEIESENAYKYTSVEQDNRMRNVYRTGGLRRDNIKDNQKQYTDIKYKDDDVDTHAKEVEHAIFLTGIKDDFYNEVGDYSFTDRDILTDKHNLLRLKENIDNIDISEVIAVRHPDVSRDIYLQNLKNRNTTVIYKNEDGGRGGEQPLDDSHMTEVYNSVFSPNQGKDLFAELTNNPTYSQYGNTYLSKLTSSDIVAEKIDLQIRDKSAHIKNLSEDETHFSYISGTIESSDSTTNILKELQANTSNNKLTLVSVLNNEPPASNPSNSEGSQLTLIQQISDAAKPIETSFNLIAADANRNFSPREGRIEVELGNTQLNRTAVITQSIDNYRDVSQQGSSVTTNFTPQQNNELMQKGEKNKKHIIINKYYSETRLEGDTYVYNREQKVLNDGDEESVHKQKLITDINKNKSDKYANSDWGGIGYIVAMSKHNHSVSSDNEQTGFIYRIPFQFNPEISGESRTANWTSQQAFGRTNEIHLWSNTSSRSMQIKTTYAVLFGNDHTDRNGAATTTEDINPLYKWGEVWTEDNVLKIISKYRMLVLPVIGDLTDIDRREEDSIAPPVVSIVRGKYDHTWNKDRTTTDYSRWIVTDLSIEPREELGYTLNRVPRVYDISLTLKEMFDNVRSYQSIRLGKKILNISR